MSRKLIAFTGKMGNGKTTSVRVVAGIMESTDTVTFVIKMADRLYDLQGIIYKTLGLPISPNLKDGKLLQVIGMWGRGYDKNLWLGEFVKDYLKKTFEFDGKKFLVLNDDTRFDNEAAKIKELGGIIVKVTRNEELIPDIITAGRNKNDESEAGIDDKYVDYFIQNDGNMMQLEHSLREILVKEGVL